MIGRFLHRILCWIIILIVLLTLVMLYLKYKKYQEERYVLSYWNEYALNQFKEGCTVEKLDKVTAQKLMQMYDRLGIHYITAFKEDRNELK